MATNHNGSLMMNASAVITDDEPLTANYNNRTANHVNLPATVTVIDVVCLSEFLSSFPDVNILLISCRPADWADNSWPDQEAARNHNIFISVPDVLIDSGLDRLWCLSNDDQRLENGCLEHLWQCLLDRCPFSQRFPFRSRRPFAATTGQNAAWFHVLQVFYDIYRCGIYYCSHNSRPSNRIHLSAGFSMETSGDR